MASRKLVQITWKGDSGQTYNIALDASIQETHTATNTITDHPVEKGINVADHIRPEPDQLSIEGEISNTPIFLPGDHADGAREIQVEIHGAQKTIGNTIGRPVPVLGALLSKIPLPLPGDTGIAKGFSPAFDRVAACYEELLKLRSEGRLCRVLTTLRTYENMGLLSLTVPRSAAYGNVLHFTIELKEVRFGSTETVPVPIIPRAKQDKGTKVPTPAEPPAEAASTLYKLVN